MAAPSVKDLPKMDETIQQEVAKEHNLKHVETTEKVVLPTADDVKQEKTHQGLIQGVEGFTPEKLKKVNTREPASGADVMKTEMARQGALDGVAKFDKTNLKDVETQEKNPLPDNEAIAAEKKHEDFKAGIEGFQKDKLSKAETVEKNTLPTKEVIEQEKTA